MSMNIRASYPGKGRTPGTQADIGRISEIWEECLSRFGHHQFLFGDFSIADAYYAPVVCRFRTYGVALAPALDAYCQRVLAIRRGALDQRSDGRNRNGAQARRGNAGLRPCRFT
jgi:glutathione S-transferase